MGKVSFDNGNTFIDAQELSRDDLSKIRNLKHMLSEDVFTELHRCHSAAKVWTGPFLWNWDDIVLRKSIELFKYDLIFNL